MSYLFILSLLLNLPSLSTVRNSFQDASQSKASTALFYQNLAAVTKADTKILVAYKGAAMTLKARYAKGKIAKKKNFKEGVGLIEYAVEQAPNNVEIRFIRLSIQENTPKFLRYKKRISEDKAFIIQHFPALQSKQLKKHIRNYVQQSKVFGEEEKSLFLR